MFSSKGLSLQFGFLLVCSVIAASASGAEPSCGRGRGERGVVQRLEGPSAAGRQASTSQSHGPMLVVNGNSRVISSVESVKRPVAPPRSVRVLDTSEIPNGRRCLRRLKGLGVRYRVLRRPYMRTGLVINSELGGVRYYGNGHIPLILDCRLAVTLARLGPTLRGLGVVAVRHSGAYVVRRTRGIRRRRLSLHAYGLAIDVHEVVLADGKHLLVSKDFVRGLEPKCGGAGTKLNEIACAMTSSGAFQELLTPDSNRAHWNHFHWGIGRL